MGDRQCFSPQEKRFSFFWIDGAIGCAKHLAYRLLGHRSIDLNTLKKI